MVTVKVNHNSYVFLVITYSYTKTGFSSVPIKWLSEETKSPCFQCLSSGGGRQGCGGPGPSGVSVTWCLLFGFAVLNRNTAESSIQPPTIHIRRAPCACACIPAQGCVFVFVCVCTHLHVQVCVCVTAEETETQHP